MRQITNSISLSYWKWIQEFNSVNNYADIDLLFAIKNTNQIYENDKFYGIFCQWTVFVKIVLPKCQKCLISNSKN